MKRVEIHTKICLTQISMLSLTGQESPQHRVHLACPPSLVTWERYQEDGGSPEDQSQSIVKKYHLLRNQINGAENGETESCVLIILNGHY